MNGADNCPWCTDPENNEPSDCTCNRPCGIIYCGYDPKGLIQKKK